MKTIFAVLAMLMPVCAGAADLRTIHAEWDYGGQAVGYRLYIDGTLRCETVEDVRVLECEVPLEVGENIFTMTAVNTDGETPHSAPFILQYDGVVLVIKGVRIL